jgi:hypothetical protein
MPSKESTGTPDGPLHVNRVEGWRGNAALRTSVQRWLRIIWNRRVREATTERGACLTSFRLTYLRLTSIGQCASRCGRQRARSRTRLRG